LGIEHRQVRKASVGALISDLDCLISPSINNERRLPKRESKPFALQQRRVLATLHANDSR